MMNVMHPQMDLRDSLPAASSGAIPLLSLILLAIGDTSGQN